MEKSQELSSEIVVYNKYAKYLKDQERRETWMELITRNKNMHYSKFGGDEFTLTDDDFKVLDDVYSKVYDKSVLPSMRSLQFGGKPIEINNARIFNCSYLPLDDWRAFQEIMFLLLSGSGVGFSVQTHHISKLPEIIIPTKSKRFLVGDSIEGWADAIKVLMKGYLGGAGTRPKFDFRDIRPKGQELLTAGGKAPGSEPLKECLFQIEKILQRKSNGDKLTSIEAHDIVCYIADAVLSGGIRRSALISLFNVDDNDMLYCKSGAWWESNPQRGRANNSAVFLRHKVTEAKFREVWNIIKANKSGEPGLFFTNDKDVGTNPCGEISLKAHQFCNLVEVNASNISSQEDLNERVRAAAILGTLQATYTDFHYLRDVWRETTEKDALVGIGLTGIASGAYKNYSLKEAASIAKETNKEWSEKLGINKASRVTTMKPSGTSSLVLGTASGVHAWYDEYFIRRIRIGKNESLYHYLLSVNPQLLEDDVFKPHIQAVLSIPQKAPCDAILRHEDTFDLLERVKEFNLEWVRNGYSKGANHNNVSATISVKDGEWDDVGEWMWNNRSKFNGLAVLPYDGGDFQQAPFETIDKNTYDKMVYEMNPIDLTMVNESEDMTDFNDSVACAGGLCEVEV